MASTLGAGDFSSLGGNQIFVTLRKAKQWPPVVVDVRCKYEQTIGELKKMVETKSGVTPDKQLVRTAPAPLPCTLRGGAGSVL
jgi:hypothetical protein